MTCPPLLVRVGFRRGAFWIPLFLVWLLILVILLPLLVLLLLAAPFMPRRWRFLPLAGGLWGVLCALRGLRVHVAEGRRRVSLDFV
jgi:hypothetical protein